MECPHCHGQMVTKEVEGETVHACPEKEGLLIPQKQLTRIIEKSWSAVPRGEAETAVLPAEEDASPKLVCPACNIPMDRYPYSGVKAIPIDGCFSCRRIWLDADELEKILIVAAKTNYARESREHARKQAYTQPTDGVVPRYISRWNYQRMAARVLFDLLR